MKRSFRFLLPLASVAAGLLGQHSAQAHQAPTSAPTEPSVVPQDGRGGPDENGSLTVDSKGELFEFILRRNEHGELFAGHRSHSSHYSHSSHRSSNY